MSYTEQENKLTVNVLNKQRDGNPFDYGERLMSTLTKNSDSHGCKVVLSDLSIPDEMTLADAKLPIYLNINMNKQDLVENAKCLLWRDISFIEKREDAQFARLFSIKLDKSITKEQALTATKEFCLNLNKQGLILDVLVIEKYKYSFDNIFKLDNANENKQKKYEIYITAPMRSLTKDGFGLKDRDLIKKDVLKSWKNLWQISLKNATETNNTKFKKVI